MLGLTNLTASLSIPSHPPPHSFPFHTTLTFKPQQPYISPKPHPLLVFASNNNNNNNNDELKEQGKSQEREKEQPPSSGSDGQQRRPLFGFNWSTLLDPDPDNVLALGLTGLLTWASVQVLWQLLFISLAILVAALKYSFIAALLIFILIALL